MDRYAFVLESLRENDFKRLRGFAPDNTARFSTWLVVVAGRLCIDYHRKRYGASHDEASADGGDWRLDFRRRLADLIPATTEISHLEDPHPSTPDAGLRADELRNGLVNAVTELDARDRMLLRLRFFDELPAREIAEVMDFPSLFHVYRRLNKVLGGLRTTMEARGFRNGQP